MEFVPLWTNILDAPNWKILDLPPDLYRFWTFCLMAAQKHDRVDGFLPDTRTLARWFGMSLDEASQLQGQLVSTGLIEAESIDGNLVYHIHDWGDWRCTKDKTTVARQRAFRAKAKEKKAAAAVVKRDSNSERNGSVTAKSRTHNDARNDDVTPYHKALSIKQEAKSSHHHPPLPPSATTDNETTNDDETTTNDGFPEFPDARTTIVTIQSGDHTISESQARQVWGHLWRNWKDTRLCYGFYEKQRWCTYVGWLYAIETVVKLGNRPGSIKYLQKIGMDFDINGPKREKPLTKGDIGPVPYKPTYAADDNPAPKTFPIIREGT